MSRQSIAYLQESSARVEGLTVELLHPNGERRTFPVEAIASSYVSIRWGMSGVYDLNLKSNVLTARSSSAQRKGKCLWRAADIVEVHAMVIRYFDKERIARQAEITRHAVSMPFVTERVEGGDMGNDNVERAKRL